MDEEAGGTPPLHPEIGAMAIRYKKPPSISPNIIFCRRKGGTGAIKVGAWGGNGGSAFDMGPAYRIISVKIFSGDVVDGVDVTFTYYGKTETRHFGGSGGTPHEIVLQEGEYLVGMAGEFGNYHGAVVLGKLGFSTNNKAYGPFGNTGGTPFSLPIAAGKISGFFGRGGKFLDAIGVYLEP
ncbi:unnamed protein product [Musa acuminata var. zebrina]